MPGVCGTGRSQFASGKSLGDATRTNYSIRPVISGLNFEENSMNSIGPIALLENPSPKTTVECVAGSLDTVRDILGESVAEQVVIVSLGQDFGDDWHPNPVFGMFMYSHRTADALAALLGSRAHKATIGDLPYVETFNLSPYELRSAIATL